MKIYPLDKRVLTFHNNVAKFLNGLTSNTMDQPRNALLNIHGKIIATFDQIKISDEEVWIVMDQSVVENVLKHLDRYLKLASVTCAARNDLQVYFDVEGNYSLSEGERTIAQKKGQIILTSKKLNQNVSEEEFTLFRIRNNIPQQGIDYKDEFLLNVSDVEFVSFTKGCYLGQEPVSKVYSRSKPSWKLVVKSEEDCTAEEKEKLTSKSFDPQQKKFFGFVFIKN